MKAFKIICLFVLALWMAWVSLTLIQTKAIAIEACGLAATHGEDENGGIRLPVVCPDLYYNEVTPGKSRKSN